MIESHIVVIGLSSLPYDSLLNDLTRLECKVSFMDSLAEIPGECSLAIVFGGSRDHEEFNKLSIISHIPWLPVQYSSTFSRLGPLIVAEETPCYECVALRIQSLGCTQEFIHNRHFELSFELLCKIIVLEVIKWSARETTTFVPVTLSHMLEFDAFHLEGELFPVYKVPSCPVCGSRHKQGTPKMPWNMVTV
ncbi:TOMM precursor leader peptide-binding protein [Paenibacillus tritici]|uniref:TOMM leader peptide-binding protein n=1 Tax=Paenibacillus tritici TaxID=1873425 RepID=A0ABX2DT23_9BACL|nr:TOMM precursor leader peptide-binding protein [Paenibacillus tritici]NQX47560.1 TOMM precursor leader peptide-binding protein [Paenibacillus tritici]